jgi:hypothetical protein
VKRTALLITASREWTDRARMFERLKRYPKGTILIHGGARGGDLMAASIGRQLGFIIHEYPYFGDLENAGGHARNRCMFAVLLTQQQHGFDCYVEAFPKGKSSGTRGMISHVKTNNKVPIEETEG